MFEERPRPRRKLPVRTLLLMVLALVAFLRMWWVMIERPARTEAQSTAAESNVVEVSPLPPDPPRVDAGS